MLTSNPILAAIIILFELWNIIGFIVIVVSYVNEDSYFHKTDTFTRMKTIIYCGPLSWIVCFLVHTIRKNVDKVAGKITRAFANDE